MSTRIYTIDVHVTTLEGQKMPNGDEIMHEIIEHLHDFVIGDSAVVDGVHIKMIDGLTTNIQDQ